MSAKAYFATEGFQRGKTTRRLAKHLHADRCEYGYILGVWDMLESEYGKGKRISLTDKENEMRYLIRAYAG